MIPDLLEERTPMEQVERTLDYALTAEAHDRARKKSKCSSLVWNAHWHAARWNKEAADHSWRCLTYTRDPQSSEEVTSNGK